MPLGRSEPYYICECRSCRSSLWCRPFGPSCRRDDDDHGSKSRRKHRYLASTSGSIPLVIDYGIGQRVPPPPFLNIPWGICSVDCLSKWDFRDPSQFDGVVISRILVLRSKLRFLRFPNLRFLRCFEIDLSFIFLRFAPRIWIQIHFCQPGLQFTFNLLYTSWDSDSFWDFWDVEISEIFEIAKQTETMPFACDSY